MAAESASERLCFNHMRQFLYLHWCPNFDECGEHHCAEPTSSSLATQPIALDAQMQEQVANKRWTMEAILMTTTDGHEQLERARGRFAQAAKEPGVQESERKRHRPEGEGTQPSSATGMKILARRKVGCSSGSALPPSPAEMTDATIEQQGEPKWRREHLEVPQAADSSSSSSSSSSESSTGSEMRLVDVCTFLTENSEKVVVELDQ